MKEVRKDGTNDPVALLRLAQAGDKEAFGMLYELYYSPIYRYFYFRLKNKDEARDLTQAVFLKVYKALDRIETTHSEPLSYFYTVARNTLIDYRRKFKETFSLEDDILERPAPTEDLEERFDHKALFEEIEEAFSLLTHDQREVVSLKFIDDLTNKEIALVLGKREDAIRQLQSRALKILKKYLDSKYEIQ